VEVPVPQIVPFQTSSLSSLNTVYSTVTENLLTTSINFIHENTGLPQIQTLIQTSALSIDGERCGGVTLTCWQSIPWVTWEVAPGVEGIP